MTEHASCNGAWRTSDEVGFIRHLGAWYGRGEGPPAPPDWRTVCLKGYLEGAVLRTEWGQVDKDVAIATAYVALSETVPA